MGLAGRLVAFGAVSIGIVICALAYAHGNVPIERLVAVFVAWNMALLAHAGIHRLIPADGPHRRSLLHTAGFAVLNAFTAAGVIYLILLLTGARRFDEPATALTWFGLFGATVVVLTFVFEWYGREKGPASG